MIPQAGAPFNKHQLCHGIIRPTSMLFPTLFVFHKVLRKCCIRHTYTKPWVMTPVECNASGNISTQRHLTIGSYRTVYKDTSILVHFWMSHFYESTRVNQSARHLSQTTYTVYTLANRIYKANPARRINKNVHLELPWCSAANIMYTGHKQGGFGALVQCHCVCTTRGRPTMICWIITPLQAT